MKKTIIIMLLLLSFAFIMSGCEDANVKKKANEAVEAFDSDDIKAVNKLVFGMEQQSVDSELRDYFVNHNNNSEGILGHVFKRVDLSVKSSTSEKVVFEIQAPDMENVFEDFEYDIDKLSQAELADYINKYADNADTKTFTAEVSVTKNGDSIELDYKSTTFINAITGGLLEKYKALYNSILEKYTEGLDK